MFPIPDDLSGVIMDLIMPEKRPFHYVDETKALCLRSTLLGDDPGRRYDVPKHRVDKKNYQRFACWTGTDARRNVRNKDAFECKGRGGDAGLFLATLHKNGRLRPHASAPPPRRPAKIS